MSSLSCLDGGTVVNPEGHTRPAAVDEDRSSPLKHIQRVRIVFLREQKASHAGATHEAIIVLMQKLFPHQRQVFCLKLEPLAEIEVAFSFYK
jgi:hypothetical protein